MDLDPKRLRTFRQIIDDPPAPIEWDVEGLIPNGNRVIWYGEFATFKTYAGVHFGLHQAAGRDWLGRFKVPVVRSVLYIDEESGEPEVHRRVKRLALGAGLEAEDPPFRVVSFWGIQFNTVGARSIRQALKEANFEPEVVIVDALRRVLPGDENSAKDVAEFWRHVDLFRGGRTFHVMHHMSKPPLTGARANRYRASGSTDILAAADLAFAIERRGREPIVTITCEKSRAMKEAPPFVVRLDFDGEEGPVRLTRVENCGGFGRPTIGDTGRVQTAMTRIEAFLADQPGNAATTGQILAHLADLGIPRRTGEEARARLSSEGRVQRIARGNYRLVGGADG